MTALYILFGVCGYLSFGVDTQGIITLNLPAGPMPLTVKGCLCFSLFFTYPVMLFPVGKLQPVNSGPSLVDLIRRPTTSKSQSVQDLQKLF